MRQHPSAIILLLAVLFSCQPETGGLPPVTEPPVEEPGGQTDQPGGQTDEPGGQTEEPGGQTDEPGGQTDQPGGQTDEPGGQTDEPGGQTDQPGGQTDEPGGQTGEPGLHKCSETEITDDMIFSSCCSRTTTSVQQGFDYDPVDNTLYFSQLNRWYRNIISWTTPAVTLSTDVAPKYMGLSCFSHGNNFIIERTASGEKYVWAPNFGSRGDGSYGNPWLFSRAEAALRGEPVPPLPDVPARLALAKAHMALAVSEKGERRAVMESRHHVAWYCRGLPGAAALRGRISRLSTAEEMYALLAEMAARWAP